MVIQVMRMYNQEHTPVDETDGYAGLVVGQNWSGTFRQDFARLCHLAVDV